jgi:hypothetical protein
MICTVEPVPDQAAGREVFIPGALPQEFRVFSSISLKFGDWKDPALAFRISQEGREILGRIPVGRPARTPENMNAYSCFSW